MISRNPIAESPERDSAPPLNQSLPANISAPRLEQSAFWVLFGRGLGILTTAGSALLLPRWLSQADNGELVTLLSLVGFAGGLACLGLQTAWIRLISEELARRSAAGLSAALAQGFRLLAGGTLLVGLVVLFSMSAGGLERFQLTAAPGLPWALALAVMLLGWQLATAAAIRGFHEVKWSSLFSGGQTGGPIVVLLFLLLVGAARLTQPIVTAAEALWLLAAALAISTPLALWRLSRVRSQTAGSLASTAPAVAELAPAASALSLAELFRICLPLTLAQIAAFCTLSADVWIASIWLDSESVALLGYAKRLLLLVSLPGQLAILTVISSISDLHARGLREELQTLMRTAVTLAAIPALVAGAVLLAAPGFLLELAFTAEYRPAAPLLVAFTLAQLVSACVGIGGYVLALTGRENWVLAINLFTALIMLPAGIAGAWFGGLHGLACASAAVLALQAVLEWLGAQWLAGVWTHLNPRTPVLKLLRESLARLAESRR